MSPVGMKSAYRGAVFDLISAFGESADARLRGNAVHALVALAASPDPSLSERANEELMQVLTAAPGGGGSSDWQRSFSERAIEAMLPLAPERRAAIGEALLRQCADKNNDHSRRRAMARLLLAAAEPPRRALAAGGWLRHRQLISLAGRAGFWQALSAVGWRTAMLWLSLPFATLLLDQTLPDAMPAEIFVLSCASLLVFWALSCLSLAGRISPPRRVMAIDVALSALGFMVLTAVATELPPDSGTLRTVDHLACFGAAALTGVLVRTARWASVFADLEPAGTAGLLRALAAVAVATLLCMAPGYAGVDSTLLGKTWVAIAPAAALAAWLDLWLDDTGPHPQVASSSRQDHRWLIPLLVATTVPLASFVAFMHWRGNLQLDLVADTVSLPGNGAMAVPRDIKTGRNMLVRLDVKEQAVYRMAADLRERTDSVLVLIDPDDGSVLEKADEPEPPVMTRLLRVGRYGLCIAERSDTGCQQGWPRVQSLAHLGRAVIGNAWASERPAIPLDRALSISRMPAADTPAQAAPPTVAPPPPAAPSAPQATPLQRRPAT